MWTHIRRRISKSAGVVIPTLVMLLFALLLNTGDLLKRPLGTHDDIPGGMERLEAALEAADWSGAEGARAELGAAMDRVRPRIELAAELSELNRFYEVLALLRGAIRARDRSASHQHLALLRLIYEDLGR